MGRVSEPPAGPGEKFLSKLYLLKNSIQTSQHAHLARQRSWNKKGIYLGILSNSPATTTSFLLFLDGPALVIELSKEALSLPDQETWDHHSFIESCLISGLHVLMITLFHILTTIDSCMLAIRGSRSRGQFDRLVLALVHKPLQVVDQTNTTGDTAIGSVDGAGPQVEDVNGKLNSFAHILGAGAETPQDEFQG